MTPAYQEVEKLLAQIRAVAHNPVVERATDQISVLCSAYMEPTSDAHKYGLTKSLAAMFDIMSRRMGQPVSHDALMNVAYRKDGEPEFARQTLSVQIHRMRKHLNPHGFYIESVLGTGYKMVRGAPGSAPVIPQTNPGNPNGRPRLAA
jgi:DNA-binding response OmpR family regulator